MGIVKVANIDDKDEYLKIKKNKNQISIKTNPKI